MSLTSPWFDAHREALADAGQRGPIADLACGRGRHALACAREGWRAIGIDRDDGFLREVARESAGLRRPVDAVRADLEAGRALPLRAGRCGAILVFRFLFRPLAPEIEHALAPGGLLLYETFTLGQRELAGGPSREAFLLTPGELPGLFPGLEVLEHREQTRTHGGVDEAVASLVARRPLHAR